MAQSTTYQALATTIINTISLANANDIMSKAIEIDSLIDHKSWGAAEGCVNQLCAIIDNLNLTPAERITMQRANIKHMFAQLF